MKITIADRLKPFSHKPGHLVMIPGTLWKVKAFPTALVFIDDQGSELEFSLEVMGPVKLFTVEQDLESKMIRIYGEAIQGYFRLSVSCQESSLILRFEKTPSTGLAIDGKTFFSGDVLEVSKGSVIAFKKPFQERLFLGLSKKKECDFIRRRRDLREILPLWYTLGAITPSTETRDFAFLTQAIEKKEKKIVHDFFLEAYLAHFSEGFVPRDKDEERQGLFSLTGFSKCLLQQGASFIRSLFFQEKEDGFYILPCLLSLFVSGKMVNLKAESGCVFDLEWTKHRLRKMFISVEKDQMLKLHFPSDVESFRLKTFFKDRGKLFSGKGTEIIVKAGDKLWFDLFQK